MAKEVNINDGKIEEVVSQEHILTQDDFDNNPDLAKQGLNVGDKVSFTPIEGGEFIEASETVSAAHENGVQIESGTSPEGAVKLEDVVETELGTIAESPIEKGESHRIVIQQTEDGSVFIHTKQKNDAKNLTTAEIVGLLEIAKSDILEQDRMKAKQKEEEYNQYMAEMIEIVVDEKDFEIFPELRDRAGKKPGEKISLPRFSVNQLLENRKK